MKCDQANSTLKGVSHWGATVDDKSRTAFAGEFPNVSKRSRDFQFPC